MQRRRNQAACSAVFSSQPRPRPLRLLDGWVWEIIKFRVVQINEQVFLLCRGGWLYSGPTDQRRQQGEAWTHRQDATIA